MKKVSMVFKDYRFWICFAITIGFICCSFFLFSDSFIRLIQSFKDFGLSFAYYFCELFYIPYSFVPSVNLIPSVGTNPGGSIVIPVNPDLFGVKMSIYWSSLWNSETLSLFFMSLFSALGNVCRYLLIVLPFLIVIWICFRRYFAIDNESKADEESKALKTFKGLVVRFYVPIKKWIQGFLQYIKENKFIYFTWALIWALNFNIIVIFIEFLAFYFYFVMSFDVGNIYIQFVKLFKDLFTIFSFIPLFLWFVLFFVLILRFRKNLAYKRLNHLEMKNRGFINSLGMVVLVCGCTGTGKTSTLTDMGLSQEVMFRDKAFEKLLEQDLMFPFFPYPTFENQLKKAIEFHQVYNLATCKVFVSKCRYRFEKGGSKDVNRCFGYDFNKYGLYYFDGLKDVYLFDMLETYCQLYFIYVSESSLIVSNYGVRVDNVLESAGNFPIWNEDFFRKDKKLIQSYSRHSHILDMDMLRLGKKLVENDYRNNAFEFGVVLISEGGKERGNQLSNRGIKADDDVANPNNDLFDLFLKMARHSATVDNFPFIRVLIDEQRPQSLGADARELSEKIVYIRDNSDMKSSLFLFSFDSLIYSFSRSLFEKYYYRYRYARSDNTLFMYIFKGISSKIIDWYLKEVNEFGFVVVGNQTEKGVMDGDFDDNKYYRCNKKIYSKRYSTDCFSDYFFQKSLKSPIGINDIDEYHTEKADIDELLSQNSYFINRLSSYVFKSDEYKKE